MAVVVGWGGGWCEGEITNAPFAWILVPNYDLANFHRMMANSREEKRFFVFGEKSTFFDSMRLPFGKVASHTSTSTWIVYASILNAHV